MSCCCVNVPHILQQNRYRHWLKNAGCSTMLLYFGWSLYSLFCWHTVSISSNSWQQYKSHGDWANRTGMHPPHLHHSSVVICSSKNCFLFSCLAWCYGSCSGVASCSSLHPGESSLCLRTSYLEANIPSWNLSWFFEGLNSSTFLQPEA